MQKKQLGPDLGQRIFQFMWFEATKSSMHLHIHWNLTVSGEPIILYETHIHGIIRTSEIPSKLYTTAGALNFS